MSKQFFHGKMQEISTKRLEKYVTQDDKTLFFHHDGEGVTYYLSAYIDQSRDYDRTFYQMVMIDRQTKKVLDKTRFEGEEAAVWGMKEVSNDLRKWRVSP